MKEPALPVLSSILPSLSPRSLRFIIIGAGSRGNAYARAVTTSTAGIIHAVAEPHPFKRRQLGRNYIWGTNQPQEGQEFADWRDWLSWEVRRRESASTPSSQSTPTAGVDGVFICTLDETHAEIIHAIAPLRLHILCEKPLALSLTDCLSVYRALQPNIDSNIFSIGHVLRYSPHNILLRKLLLTDRVIGDIVSLEHCEPVGWWHFAHSYVRGNWRRETAQGDGSLLTKSCHDIDFIMWLLSSPAAPQPASTSTPDNHNNNTAHKQEPHHPRTITSTGSLTQFRRHRKPHAAGAATNCLSCPAERNCKYSAVKIYDEMHVAKGNFDWPVNIVCPDIEDVVAPYASTSTSTTISTTSSPSNPDNKTTISPEAIAAASAHLHARLRASPALHPTTPAAGAPPSYGHCVYEADNTVCDDQIVTITWSELPALSNDDPEMQMQVQATAKTAVFHMIAPTEKQCERRGRVYGTEGELAYDGRRIEFFRFANRETTVIDVPRQPPEEEKAHGGGDYGLARGFVAAVDAVVNGRWAVQKAQEAFVGCTLEEAVRSHAVVFAAEEARREEKVVRWAEWWEGKLREALVL